MRESSPFTKRPESLVEYCFASSTASVIATAVGHVGAPRQLVGADAQQRAVDDRHALERPVLGELRDDRVDLLVMLVDAEHEALRVLVGRDREARRAAPGRCTLRCSHS